MFDNFVYFENSMHGIDTERVVRFRIWPELVFYMEDGDVVQITDLEDIENFKRNVMKLDE